MKTNWRKPAVSLLIAAIGIMAGCKKNEAPQPQTQPVVNKLVPNNDNYSSMANFFAKNGAQMQTYTINGATGGSFKTPQGTVVTIPANAFYNNLYQIVTGPVTINFKDIYKKSDMLLSNVTTNAVDGTPLKSGGEFYIKATAAGSPLTLAQTIAVTQPLNGTPLDTTMKAYVKNDTTGLPQDTVGWAAAHFNANLLLGLGYYVYDLAQFNPPTDSGSWCNTDEPNYFAAYAQAALTVHETDTAANYGTYVYLIIKNINTTCACHTYSADYFNYAYVPLGMACTIVAVGVKNGKVYSSFTPITLSVNQTANFSMTETTTAAFEATLNALN
ncbi:MAG TPA: hypothetical protein VNZ45_08995 [Bacteroidia bacterium]|jgi:hypothetical protein|nr:hypothetical protein [Bacteroidia bacterium]